MYFFKSLLLGSEDTTNLDHNTWLNQAFTDLEASFLTASFHNARSCYTGCWEILPRVLLSYEPCELQY